MANSLSCFFLMSVLPLLSNVGEIPEPILPAGVGVSICTTDWT